MTLDVCVLLAALALDYFFGEPKRFHPLVGLGWVVKKVEQGFNQSQLSKIKGGYGVSVILIPIGAFAYFLEGALSSSPFTLFVCTAFILYLAIGWKSLLLHSKAIRDPLEAQDIETARQKVALIVSRDTAALDETGVSKAATESVLENGSDAIFAPIFWFLVGGIPGVVLYRVVNTLDAMWGYKNERFFHFGWAAAKLDDVLNWVPARICALSYALCGQTWLAFKCWSQQAQAWKSPNAGPVMASGAGALNVMLGGVAHYQGDSEVRPPLGCGAAPTARIIKKAEALLNRSLLLWVLVIITGAIYLQ